MATTLVNANSRASELFHALSDETRLDILDILKNGGRCVCDLTSALEAAQSRLSFHLRVLKDAGIVSDRKDGRWVHYELNHDAFAEIEGIVGELKPRARSSRKAQKCCG